MRKGRSPILTEDEEREIAAWITGSVERGSPRSSLDVITGANMILRRRMGVEAQDLGRGWLEKFRRDKISPIEFQKISANLPPT